MGQIISESQSSKHRRKTARMWTRPSITSPIRRYRTKCTKRCGQRALKTSIWRRRSRTVTKGRRRAVVSYYNYRERLNEERSVESVECDAVTAKAILSVKNDI